MFFFNNMDTETSFELHHIPVVLPTHGDQAQYHDKSKHDICWNPNDIGIVMCRIAVKDQPPGIDKPSMGEKVQAHDEEIGTEEACSEYQDVDF